MASDKLFVEIERQYGTITLEGYFTSVEEAHAPRGVDFLEAEHQVFHQEIVMLDLSDLSSSEVLPYVDKCGEITLKKPIKAGFIVLMRVYSNSPAWVSVCKRAKFIHFLTGKGSLGKGNQPLALIYFWGEVKGSPIVKVLDLDAIDDLPPSFNRKRHLMVKNSVY